jgi:hypothetical protein
MAGGTDCYARGEIEKEVAILVANPQTLGGFGHKRIHAGVRWRDKLTVHLNELRDSWAGKCGFHLWVPHGELSPWFCSFFMKHPG